MYACNTLNPVGILHRDRRVAIVAMDVASLERYTVDGVGRIYTDGDTVWPSVSTVLGVRDTPEAVKNWEANVENAEAIKSYKQNRGTLAHVRCLQQLVPSDDSGTPKRYLWGEDESQSEQAIQASGNWDRWVTERDWIDEAWSRVCVVLDIDHVHDVETYVINTDVGYSGQFDLLYEDTSSNTVLADIKTGKGVYKKNKLQSAAYREAVPMVVDRCEILRMNPDKMDWEVSRSAEWDETHEELFETFEQCRDELPDSKIEAIVDEAASGNALVE